MKPNLYSILLLCCLLFCNSLSARNALWVWDMADDIVLNEKNRIDFWSFIEAPHAKTELKISIIYLSIGKNLLNDYPKKVSEFIADAHSRGIMVEYLTGDPLWSLTNTNPDTGEAYNQPSFDELDDLLAYNASVPENERFDGYHQDTEPYILGIQSYDPLSWKDDTEEIWNQFVATMQAWKSIIDAHNNATGDDLIMGSAIPYWFDIDTAEDGSEIEYTTHQAIQDIVDYVSIMNYNTRVSDPDNSEIQGFNETVLNEINYDAPNLNSVYVGMETIEFNYKEPVDGYFRQLYTPTSSYFYGRDGGNGSLGSEGLAEDISFLKSHFSNSPSYGGIAFHYYEDIKNGDSAFRALGYESNGHAPAVWVIRPSFNETLSGIETIAYVAYDPDGDALGVTVEYSYDGGANWALIAAFDVSDQTDEVIYRTLSWDVSSLPIESNYWLRITAIEATAEQLSAYDRSDYPFSIVASKTDTENPASVNQSSIGWSYNKLNEINLWWDESTDNDKIAGYYYSYLPNNPHIGSFTRGNRVRLAAPSVDSVLYIWAVDSSGNLSAQTSYGIWAIEDIDKDGIVDDSVNELDRDGDGVSNTDEIDEGTNPDDPLDFSNSRLVGHWMFEGNLNNSVTGEPALIVDNDNGNITDGLLNYTNGVFSSGSQAIEISGSEPVWLPLEINPVFHSDVHALTIEMWIKPDQASRSDLSFIPLACFGDLDAGLTLLLKNDGDLLSLRRYTGADSGTYASINAQNDDLFDGEWHHVACSYNGYNGAFKLYIDGKLVNSGQKNAGSLQNTRPLRFFDGRSNYDDQNGSGDLFVYSGQFENNKFDFIDESKIRYLGLVDNIKVTKAAVPIELLGYYQDQSKDYNVWKENVFGTNANDPQLSNPEVDYSKDGINNFLTYTSGLDPTVNNSANFNNSPAIEAKGGQQFLTLRYLESKTATSSFQVQTKTTLGSLNWTDQKDIVSYLDGESDNSWIKKVSVPFDSENDRLFIRLKTNMGDN